jgi:hypothetical protein
MHQKLIKEYNGSFAMAMKKYLIEELSKKMTEQGKCRMQNEMLENIDRIRRVYRYCKKREYQEIEAFLDAYKKTYFPDKIESNYIVADIQFAFDNRKLI